MKKILFILFLLICIYFFTEKAESYEAFDGNYKYNQVGSGSYSGGIQNNSNEEILFVVDFSSSMKHSLGGTPRIYLAIDAIRSILANYGKDKRVGLRIFGVTDKPLVKYTPRGIEFIKENICSASMLILPIARYNSDNIADRLSNINPQGATPIGYSLRQAVQNDFSIGSHTKHIILVTDGAENCGDDPCVFIRQLMQLRKDYVIDVIGITVQDNEYSKLKCISSFSGGKYYSVNTPSDFKSKFEEAINSRQTPSYKALPILSPDSFKPPTKYSTYGFQFEY